jgi:holo-ACP synthase
LTSSAKSVRSFLDARDSRQDRLSRCLCEAPPATVFLSLNIPGREKMPAGAQALFLSMLAQLAQTFPGLLIGESSSDALGPYAIIALQTDPLAAKRCCIALEAGSPAARLIDLDVYSGQGVQIGRASLGVAARACLLCRWPAVDCIRLQRHSIDEVIARTHELLSAFRT